jgi:ribonuclease-3
MEGNAFEALMGAIYLDRGYNACMRFIEKRILKTMINIDKVAYKEVNFKSKLIEWSQKNKIKLDFELVNQGKDAQGSPFFVYKVLLEGVEAGQGKGYSKKESQQLASKETLKQLKRLPQFIDAVFAAKAERTKMEEEPVQMVPDVDDNNEKVDTDNNKTPKKNSNIAVNDDSIQKTIDSDGSEFDLSDINVAPELKTREDIIAAAEEQAYKDN